MIRYILIESTGKGIGEVAQLFRALAAFLDEGSVPTPYIWQAFCLL